MTNDGLNTLVYNAESRVVSNTQAGATSTYSDDGNNLRVKKISGSTTTTYIFSGAKVVAEYTGNAKVSSPTKEYIYAGAQLVATTAGRTTNYHLADHLSPRVTTDTSGNIVGQQGHFPFGESWYAQNTTTKWQFTSYERDSESGNDYAMMRSYVNRLGRFSSPDPWAGRFSDPQSLNRYAYTRNDPVNLVDPLGLCWIIMGDQLLWAICVTTTESLPGGGGDPTGDPGGGLGGGGGVGGPQHQPLQDGSDGGGGGKAPMKKDKKANDDKAERLKKYNDCVKEAQKVRNKELAAAYAEVGVGIIGIELTIYAGAKTIPVFAGEAGAATNPGTAIMAADHAVRAAGPALGKGVIFGGLYGKGIYDATQAINKFDRAVSDCAAKYGYPNVPNIP